jgi:hypothetical protein
MDAIYVGIDVSKDRLDVHVRPSREAFAVSRDGKDLEQLIERLQGLSPRFDCDRSHRRLLPRRKKTTRDQLELLMPVDSAEDPAVKGDFIDPRFMKFGAGAAKGKTASR